MTPIEQVLELARWAPSGDNTQPWRFEITGDRSCVIHGFDTRQYCVYDLTGAPSQIAVGAMLETARIAASGLGMRAEVQRLEGDEETPRFELRLVEDANVTPSPLVPYIQERSTNRRPFLRRPLTAQEKLALQSSLGTSYSIVWIEGAKRKDVAKLLCFSAKIRLTIPEAYEVHRSVIEWGAQFSETKIPDRAVGLDAIGLLLMRWAMKSWRRTSVLSRFFGGTLLPRIQLDYLPGLGCAAHVFIVGEKPPQGIGDFLAAGAAVQRFWLTATRLGLQHQPEMTPLIFAGYARTEMQFSRNADAQSEARSVNRRLTALTTEDLLSRAVWLGRIGQASAPTSRSLRRPLRELLIRPPEGG